MRTNEILWRRNVFTNPDIACFILRTLLICMFYEIIYTHARKCDDLSLKSR